MRTLLRRLATSVGLTALVIGVGTGATTALAAAPVESAMSSARYEFDDEWCVDRGATSECTVVDAALVSTMLPDGREIARISIQELTTTVDADGRQVGGGRAAAFDRTVFASGGPEQSFSVSHTRAVGPLETCVSTYRFEIVDYELVVERAGDPGCS